MQGEVGKHSGESEAYTNLAGGWKEGTLLVGGGGAGEARAEKMWPRVRPSYLEANTTGAGNSTLLYLYTINNIYFYLPT